MLGEEIPGREGESMEKGLGYWGHIPDIGCAPLKIILPVRRHKWHFPGTRGAGSEPLEGLNKGNPLQVWGDSTHNGEPRECFRLFL